jgi:hypothetical protein
VIWINDGRYQKDFFFFYIISFVWFFSEEYERVNAELRMKITTLEKVTTTLKSGLVNNFQRKNSA